MKKFEKDGKINFVDENNIFVGYDNIQNCCEEADWFISKEKPRTITGDQEFNLDGFVFDKDFFERTVLDQCDLYSGDSVLFRIVDKDNSEAFLCLYNSHNGYYGHGFTMDIGGISIHGGCL